MIRQFTLILLAIFGLRTASADEAASVKEAGTTRPEAYWKEILSHIHLRMERAEVEKLLDEGFFADISATPRLEAKKGGAHRALYRLDANWCAAITFDWHGFATKNNPYMLLHLYEHRVIATPQLLTTAECEKLQEWDRKVRGLPDRH